MKIYSEMGISDFSPWSGAVDTHNRIIETDNEAAFDALIDELYPDGLSDTDLNDLLWFESDWIYESLGIREDDDDEDDEENDAE